MTTEYPWQPLSPEQVAALFADCSGPWWIAGGWAIDLLVGRQTRPHGDIDVAILRDDVPLLGRLLAGWDIQIAHDGKFLPWFGGPLAPQYHQFWCRRRPNAPWAFEILTEDAAAETWYYRRDRRVRAPLASLEAASASGVRYLAPEFALLYKASRHDLDRNAADFDLAAPLLTSAARGWLRSALELAHPGNPWILRL